MRFDFSRAMPAMTAAALLCLAPAPASAFTDTTKTFEEYTAAEKTAARETAKAAMAAKKTVKALRICGDPGNMPYSSDKLEGFQNKIADVLARAMGTQVSYFWRPSLERGLTRQTFDSNECDVFFDIPAGYGTMLTTNTIYRTTYTLAWREDSKLDIKSLGDPRLKTLRLGVFQHSGLREALLRRGIRDNVDVHTISHDADLTPENQPWRQVQRVAAGELDVAGVWGPFAGYAKSVKGAPVVIQPVNLMEEEIPMEFDLAIGVRRTDVTLKYMLDFAMEANKAEIEAILRQYGVPLVQCSACLVAGDLPAHGPYTAPLIHSGDRAPAAAADQVVTHERVEGWLASGSSLQEELSDAINGVDVERVKFLIGKGADVNALDLQGYGALHAAARLKKPELLQALIAAKADVNAPDREGWTPLIQAAYRNHIPSVELLVRAGADKEKAAPGGYTALGIALSERRFEAAIKLAELGADVKSPTAKQQLTPLMIAASQLVLNEGANVDADGKRRPGPIEAAEALITRGADVNARSADGLTPLMVAAVHNNTPMIGLLIKSGADATATLPDGRTALGIARDNANDSAVKMITRMQAAVPTKSRAEPR
jgi:quinoprotein dehydrogenase-associated probable ABC transporter substrate-binding protein